MAGRIQGKVAVVTGGCSGIGLATVQRFVEEGARVVIGDIDEQRGHELVGQLGGEEVATFVSVDVTSKEQVDALFQTAGQFDRTRLDGFLQSLGLSESQYLARLRNDILRNRLIAAVTGPATASDTVARLLARWRGEQRRGKVLVVESEAMNVAAPEDGELRAFLDEHAGDYRAPERRKVELVLLAADDLLAEAGDTIRERMLVITPAINLVIRSVAHTNILGEKQDVYEVREEIK